MDGYFDVFDFSFRIVGIAAQLVEHGQQGHPADRADHSADEVHRRRHHFQRHFFSFFFLFFLFFEGRRVLNSNVLRSNLRNCFDSFSSQRSFESNRTIFNFVFFFTIFVDGMGWYESLLSLKRVTGFRWRFFIVSIKIRDRRTMLIAACKLIRTKSASNLI